MTLSPKPMPCSRSMLAVRSDSRAMSAKVKSRTSPWGLTHSSARSLGHSRAMRSTTSKAKLKRSGTLRRKLRRKSS